MSSQKPTVDEATSSKTANLDNIEELSMTDLNLKGESFESEKKTNAQHALDSAREKLLEQVNTSRKPVSPNLSPAGLPMKAGIGFRPVGTKLTGRDGALMIQAATQLTRRDFASMLPASTRLNNRDDGLITFKSMKPQGTLLHNRDYFASMAPGTMLTNRDVKSVLPDKEAVDKFTEITGIPKSFAPSADTLPTKSIVPSALKTSDDAVKAVQQIYFKELTEEEKEEQLRWVQNILKNADPCPQGKNVRFPYFHLNHYVATMSPANYTAVDPT